MKPSHFTDALSPGSKLLWFEIEKVLGKGGFGITYLGKDTNLNQLVAIKEYLPSAYSSRGKNNEVRPNSPIDAKIFEWGLDRFLKEAQILARFRHPCIVKVVSFFRDSNTAYMVMEYVEGEGLDAILKREKTLDEVTLKKMVPTILDGLETLHNADYIHRDIKPPNIYIRKKNNLPVILDFGSARQSVAGQGDQMTSLLSMGYSPFEQYDSSGDRQGPWSDIYAMGGVLYRAITGSKPKDAAIRISARLRNDPDPMLSAEELGKGRYSQKFLKAIDMALKVLENDRPQSVGEWRPLLLGQTAIEVKTKRSVPTSKSGVTDDDKPTITKRKKSSWSSFISSMDKFSTRISLGSNPNTSATLMTSPAIPAVVAPKPAEVRRINPIFLPSSNSSDDSEIIKPSSKSSVRTSPPLEVEKKVPDRKVGTTWVEPVTKMGFVWIPGSTFLMGSPPEEVGRKEDEGPVHEVELNGFWIGVYPVTWGKWRRVMGNYPPGLFQHSKANFPVERISWRDVQKFLGKFSRLTGTRQQFRLPTEAEWECVARAGSSSSFPFGDSVELSDYAWYKNNARGQTKSVGGKKPNAWGVFDMFGNVSEWVSDRYHPNYYEKSRKQHPLGPAAGENRVVRGGGWESPALSCRPAHRHRLAETATGSMLGFRLVRVE